MNQPLQQQEMYIGAVLKMAMKMFSVTKVNSARNATRKKLLKTIQVACRNLQQ
jgi:hypothetical protein